METTKRYERFPVWIVVLTNLVTLATYALGFMILFRAGLVFALLYLLFAVVLEIRLIRNHCSRCYYYGKTCGFGRGRLSAWFFKKGDASRFCNKQMTWKDMIPDWIVILAPLLTGIVLLILDFDYILLSAIVLLIFLSTFVTGFIRGNLTCSYCKQRDLGCPAEALFNKGKKPHD